MDRQYQTPAPATHETGMEFSLLSMWKALKRRAWIAAVVAVVVGVLQYVVAVSTYVPMYSASANFVVSITNDRGTTTTTYNNLTAAQMAKTFPYILQSGILENVVASDMGYTKLPGRVSAVAVEETNIFTLTVYAGTPQLAVDLLNSVIKNYPQVAEFVVGATTMTMLTADSLEMVTDPINEVSPLTAVLVGLLAGLVACVVIVGLYMMLHRTVCTVEDIRELTNVKCLAEVPDVQRKNRTAGRSAVLITQRRISRSFVESIYRLRIGVERAGKQVLMVTSSLVGEGKSTLAINLALSLAKNGKRVVLIDCDLRHPLIGRYLGISGAACQAGLSEYLQGKATVEQIGYTVSNMSNLIVVPGGATVKNSSELVAQSAMQELIDVLRKQADYIIMDTPPCSILADSAVMGRYADGVIYAIRQDCASHDSILRGMENVTISGVPLIGVVLNGVQSNLHRYGYDEYYSAVDLT